LTTSPSLPSRRFAALTAAAAALLMLAPASVLAASHAASPARASSAPSTGPPAAPAPPPPAAPPVAGSMRLAVVNTGTLGEPFALEGERIAVRGTVSPYVPGQRVSVVFYRGGHRVAAIGAVIRRHGHGRTGTFSVAWRSRKEGIVKVVAVHRANARLGRLSTATRPLHVISPDLGMGARGSGVSALQRALGALHYAVPQSGYFDEATADAVIAYTKMTGLPRVPYANAALFHELERRAGAYRVRFPWDGRHIEADLSRQILVEVARGGRVLNIYPTSSGKPSTPTVVGHFHVYLKTPGLNSELMLDANYFISGYAIHGYPEVPTYPASHGCLRVPNLDALPLYSWIRVGTAVDVYG
jgi:hypothetical protein